MVKNCLGEEYKEWEHVRRLAIAKGVKAVERDGKRAEKIINSVEKAVKRYKCLKDF